MWRTFFLFQADLYHEHTNASGFTFMSKAYHTNWPSSNIVNDLIIGKHTSIDGQPPSYFTRKNLYKPKYMHAGEISNHYPKPANPDNPM